MKVWLPTVRAGSGSDVFVQRLARGLERSGHEPVVEWFSPRIELMPWLLARHPMPPGIDVVHANSWQAFALRRDGIPLVVTEHHYVQHPEFQQYRGVAQALYHKVLIQRWLKWSYARADALVAVSESTAAAMRTHHSNDVRVIHNWVDTDLFSPSAHQERSPGRERFRVLFVGNPARRKGSDLLPALAKMLGQDFDLLCLGGLRKSIEIVETQANVVAVPWTAPDEMPNLYRSVDAVVVLARYEAFGFVALEAMACGVPVIGFDSTGTAEICVHGQTGLLSPVDDLTQISDHLRLLRDNQSMRHAFSTSGRRRALALFGESTGVARYIDAYSECISRKRPGAGA